MKKYSSLLLAAALILGIAAFAPVPAQAVPWCDLCDADPYDCFACCKCDGGTTAYCGYLCGSPDSLETEATLTLVDEDETLACTADEAPGTDEAPSTDEPAPVASR